MPRRRGDFNPYDNYYHWHNHAEDQRMLEKGKRLMAPRAANDNDVEWAETLKALEEIRRKAA